MNRLGRWARLLAITCAVAAAAGLDSSTPTVTAADRSFELVSLETTAFIRADASLAITEVVTYDFHGGPFTVGIRSFEDDLERVGDFVAADDQGPLTVDPPSASVSGDYEWRLREPTSDRRMTFTLTYTVRDAVQLGRDVGDLNWRFVGTEHPGIGQVSILVVPPVQLPTATPETEDTDASVLRAFAHGPANGTVSVQPTGITATVTSLAAEQFVELRIVLPVSAFTSVGTSPLLAGILTQERQLIEQRVHETQRNDDQRRTAYLWTPLLSIGSFLGVALLWLAGGREPRPREVQGRYWREPLDEPPAIAITNQRRGAVPVGRAFAGTLVDLAQRGYVRIVAERQERFGPDRTIHHYEWAGRELGPEVTGWERALLDFVFRGQQRTDSVELEEWAKDHQTDAHRRMESFEGAIHHDWEELGWENGGRRVQLVVLFLVCAAAAGGSVVLQRHTHHPVAWVGVGVAVAMFFLGLRLLSNRSQAGVEAAAKADGLQRYIEDFSRLEDAPIGHLVLWERYLVAAVAFGVADDLLRGLNERLPAVVADPTFASWYVQPAGGHTRFDGFSRMESASSAIIAASTPSSTGSGGGFSGGSSGGGGGGGFGAR